MMPRGHGDHATAFLNLTGRKFGRWTVISLGEKSPSNRIRWNCACECGTEKLVLANHLVGGRTNSCGCIKKRRGKNSVSFKHGGKREHEAEYRVWMQMRSRCNNPRSMAYESYGGRGIKVCSRWNSFSLFFKDMGPRPSLEFTLDRKNNDGDYTPGNCRWATRTEQGRNKRNNLLVPYNGAMMPLSQACELSGVNYNTAKYRVYNNHPWNEPLQSKGGSS